MKTSIIIIIIILLATSILADDESIMSKLANSLHPAPPNWFPSAPPCKWAGVKCDSDSRITSISLASKSLSGTLPPELNGLDNLKSLSVQHNSLSGTLPSFANLVNLQQLLLEDNAFSSVPPLFLSGLTSLQTFTISENTKLASWEIPDSLSDSTSLVSFMASNANVVGSIPSFFGILPNLQALKISYNNITGSLPGSFSGSGIQILLLNNQATGLSGRIDVLGTMSQLSQVWLHANSFSGPIPDLSKCGSLFDFQLRDNRITGVVPTSMFSLPKLVNVTLQNNKLQGPVPEFGSTVQVTLGSTNSFCTSKPGPCDPQVTALIAVAGAFGYPVALADSWKGNDPCKDWSFITCNADKNVSVINLGKQNWPGTISPVVADLTSLKTLLLNDNNITGTIPASLAKLPQLQLIDISNNNISGKVPDFSSNVNVKTSGNPLIGTVIATPNGEGTEGNSPASSNGVAINGSPISLGATIGITCMAIAVIGAISYLAYKFYTKRRYQIEGNVGGYGEVLSQSSVDNNEHINVYDDGGNATIPIEILREVTNNFSDDNILGRGGFGIVYKGKLHDGTKIAVKRMEASAVSSKGVSEFQAEISVLTKVRHRHLVALHGFCINGNERLLVYQYMSMGTLAQHLFEWKEKGTAQLKWKQRVTIAVDVARGIEYLHSLAQQSFIHRDLKPSNILLDDDFRAKVSDFGLVKNAPDGKYSLETRLAGTFGYLAPEYAATGRVTVKVDIFAYGVVLMELITGRQSLDDTLPEEKSNLISYFRKHMNNKDSIRTLIDTSLEPDEETFESISKVAELAGYCTAREPSQRPDMGHVVNVLAPLVDQWKPTASDEDDSIGIDNYMNLPRALQRWQEEDSSFSKSDFLNSHSHISRP